MGRNILGTNSGTNYSGILSSGSARHCAYFYYLGPGQKEMVTLKLEVYVQEGGVARVERYPDTSCPALLHPPTQLAPIVTGRVFVNRQAVQTSNVKVTVMNPGQSLLCIRKGEELGLVEIQKRQFSQGGGFLFLNFTRKISEFNRYKYLLVYSM
jgi:hypothetical protein